MTEKQLSTARHNLANACRKAREDLGITQKQLAETTGLGIATIQRFERGAYWLGTKQYVLIRSALNMPEIN